ncbi:hypothetical protein [Enterococcus sp. AZ126]|uniref:hypothetical protein n=1 Tax=Enterococcus sp. AZ126 TaxID=2774635 RepID=UPI003F1EF6F7
MKHKLINALLDTPLAILIGFSFRQSLLFGFFMIAVYVFNKVFELPKIIKVNGRKRKIID